MLSYFCIGAIVENAHHSEIVKKFHNFPLDDTFHLDEIKYSVGYFDDYEWLEDYMNDILFIYDGIESNMITIENIKDLRDHCQQLIAKDEGDMVQVMSVIEAIDNILKLEDRFLDDDDAIYYLEYRCC